jgi:hypothetical protein
VVFCAAHVESPTLQFLFEDTSDAALVRWKSLRTATNHLPRRENCRRDVSKFRAKRQRRGIFVES